MSAEVHEARELRVVTLAGRREPLTRRLPAMATAENRPFHDALVTTMDSNVDVLVPDRDEDKMKTVLRRVLEEARKTRGSNFFADKNAKIFVVSIARPFTSTDDIDKFADEVIRDALKK